MIKTIDIFDDNWDEIVHSFNNYDVYYLRDYVKAFQIHGDGEPQLLFYEDKDIRVMNVVMKRIISKELLDSKGIDGEYYDYATPYGYGGFLIEGNNSKEANERFFNEYYKYCLDNHIVCEFIRFHPLLENAKEVIYGIDVTQLGQTITIPLTSKEEIWNNLVGKNRNVIRKALKNGVKVYWGRSKELYEKFITMYNSTMDKDKATDYYYFKEEFYESVLEDLKYNSMIFYAIYENKIIAMSIVMFCNDYMHYHLSASDINYLKLAPTNLLLYEAAVFGVTHGYKKFHLGGGLGSSEDSLFKFKKSFVKEYVPTYFSIGKKIYNSEIYEKLSIGIETNYFPKYRGN